MKQINKIAAGIALSMATAGASAATFVLDASNSVGNEAASTGLAVGTKAAKSIELITGMSYTVGNRVFLKLSDGAKFSDLGYTLYASEAGPSSSTTAMTLNGYKKGDSVLEFIVASATRAGTSFVLSGSAQNTTVAAQAVKISVPKTGPVTLSANAKDNIGDYDPTAKAGNLFYYANEFSAAQVQVADGQIDVNRARLKFTDGKNFDTVGLELRNAALSTQVTLDKDDALIVTLSGDMSGIGKVVARSGAGGKVRGDATISVPNGTAVFAFSGSDLGNGTETSALLDITGATSVALTTRSFKLAASLDFKSEDTKAVLASTTAGAWTINGLQAVIPSMSLNASGFISWLKVANTGKAATEVYADIIATLSDGTEKAVTGALLGTIDAGGVGTISEAAIVNARGGPTTLVASSLTITVTSPNNAVHLSAEKKASDGRVSIPVFYDNGDGTVARIWFLYVIVDIGMLNAGYGPRFFLRCYYEL